MSNPAETYESYMVPPLFAPLARRLLEIAKPEPGERVLDVACGTGVVARQVAQHIGAPGKVVGLDLNPNMLAVARTMAEREGHSIEWHEGRAESLPFPDRSFDLVLCQVALMFFADRPAAVGDMHRVLSDRGRVGLSVWQSFDRHPFYRTLDDSIAHHLGTSSVRDIFALGDPDELRALLTSAGFHDVELAPFFLTARFPDPESFLAGEIDVDTAAIPAMQHLDAAARQKLTAAIREDMAEPLRQVTEGDYVVMPFHAHIALAQP